MFWILFICNVVIVGCKWIGDIFLVDILVLVYKYGGIVGYFDVVV